MGAVILSILQIPKIALSMIIRVIVRESDNEKMIKAANV